MSIPNRLLTSKGENVSESQVLTSRILALDRATDWWNTAMIWALVLAALSAIAVVGTTVMALRRAKQVGTAQSELIQLKDNQLALDLGDKNVKIAQAGRDASEANRGAAEASERAASAQASLALAEQHAAEANTKGEGFRLDIAKANERAASASETAERERLARLQLEARLADRCLTPEQVSRLTTALSVSKGEVVDVVIFGNTPEIVVFSSTVLDSMRKAGWVVNTAYSAGGGETVKGLLVGVKAGSDPASAQAANALIGVLKSSGIGAGPWEFAKLMPPGGMLQVSVAKGETMFNAPIRVFIGSK
jgi:hypothetical protein